MRLRSITVVIAAALLAGACAGSTTGTDPEPVAGGGSRSMAAEPTGADTATGEPPIPEILDFEARLVGGGTIRGAELAGAPVAVWFWAPW